jgi:hypothetical protein
LTSATAASTALATGDLVRGAVVVVIVGLAVAGSR